MNDHEDILLSLVPKQELEKLLKALLDEKEFLSPGGIRSISKIHETPYSVNIDGRVWIELSTCRRQNFFIWRQQQLARSGMDADELFARAFIANLW